MAEENNTTRDPRRRLLKTIAAGGSAAGLAALPGKWAKPVVASVILPAHAQTSPGCIGTAANCPSGYSFSDSGSYADDKTIPSSITTEFPGITWDGTTFSGSDSTQKYTVIGSCAAPCDDVDAGKYFSKTLDFSGTGADMGFSFEYRCGGEPVVSGSAGFYGHPTALTGKYTGDFSYNVEGCYYLDSTVMRQRSPRGFRNFRFGG